MKNNNTDVPNSHTVTNLDTKGKWVEGPFTMTARYGLKRTVYRLDENTYLVEGPSEFSRFATDGYGFVMADLEGGPHLERGLALDLCLGDFIPVNRFIKEPRFLTYAERCEHLGLHQWGEPEKTHAYCLVTCHPRPTQP